MNQDYYVTKTWEDQLNNCGEMANAFNFNRAKINSHLLNMFDRPPSDCWYYDNPIEYYIIGAECDSCNGHGCYVCNATGVITYYFNSEPDDPNVIEMMDKMMNEI